MAPITIKAMDPKTLSDVYCKYLSTLTTQSCDHAKGNFPVLVFWYVLKLAAQGTRCERAWGPRPPKTRLSTVEWPVAVLRRVFGRVCAFGRVLRVP